MPETLQEWKDRAISRRLEGGIGGVRIGKSLEGAK
jgi:hypothetical protein